MKVNTKKKDEERLSMFIIMCIIVLVMCSKNMLIIKVQIYKRRNSQRRNIIERSKQNIIFV